MEKSYKKTTGSFKSANGISDIAYYIYTPPKGARAALQIVHGMSEFIERYEEFADFLCANGVAVFGCDHIGHGNSVKKSEDKGYFFTPNGWRDMIADCRTMMNIGKNSFPQLPYIMLGHSMGSFVVRAAAVKFGSKIDAAIFSGTGTGMPALTAQLAFLETMAAAKGGRYRSKLADDLAFGKYNSHIAEPKTQSDWLTHDHDKIIEFLSDEKYVDMFTLNGFINLAKLSSYVNRDEWYVALRKDMPILMFSGSEDPVGNWGEGVKEVYEKLLACGCNVSLKLYEDGRHEMLNEIQRQQVYKDVLDWIDTIAETE